MDPRIEQDAISRAAERVCARFPGCGADEVNQVVARCHHEYDGRPIREFVPILVERDAVDALLTANRTSQVTAPA